MSVSNANIRAVPLDVEKLWELAQISRKPRPEQALALYDFIEDHNHKDVIMAYDGKVKVSEE
jgi:hypothetical protein